MTIFKALGIIFVVVGHKYDPFSWFPIYSFHMALFFFASGYFYNEKYEDNIGLYIIKKCKKTILIYFIFNLFYMLVTLFIYKKYNILLGSLPGFKSFFINPFINGHQYLLFLPAWFALALVIIQIVFIVLHKNIKRLSNNIHIHLMIFFVLGISATSVANIRSISNQSPILILIRTLFGLFFYYLGFYYNKKEKVDIFNSIGILIAVVINIIMINKFKEIQYYLVWGDFRGHVFMPFVSSITAIYTYLFIAKALSKILKENDILYKIGENTLSIMFNHIFVFFSINFVVLKITHGDLNQLKDIWFAYKIGFYWPVYILLGVLVPVLLSEVFKKLKKFIAQKIDFNKIQINN